MGVQKWGAGEGGTDYDSPPNDDLQIVHWQMTFCKICHPEPPLYTLFVF